MLAAGALSQLLPRLSKESKLSFQRTATWAVSNLCRGKPPPDFALVRPALPKMAEFLNSSDDKVLIGACEALSSLSDGTNDKIQAVLDAGVCPQLAQLLGHSSPAVQTPALCTVSNIVTGDENQTQTAIQSGVLPALTPLLSQKVDCKVVPPPLALPSLDIAQSIAPSCRHHSLSKICTGSMLDHFEHHCGYQGPDPGCYGRRLHPSARPPPDRCRV